VLAVSYGGHSGETEAIGRWCELRGLALIEDAAHSAGSRVNGRHLGTFGLAGAFSMFSNKNLAVGEGGMLITSDAAISSKVRLLRSHGMTSLTWDRHRGHASDYDVVAMGFNYRIDEPRAALALSRLGRLDDDNRRRAVLDAGYREALTSARVTVPLAPVAGLQSSHHLFTIVVPDGMDRDGFRRQMATGGVQTSVHYPPAHQMSVYRGRSGPLPATEAYAARSVTLPMFAHMTARQQGLVVETATQALATATLA
jgi:dTDP-4-amino-4,6-dideoxygalactose transaminase